MIEQIAKILLSHQWTLAVAESCTGGRLSAEATRLSGSSLWYKGGVIAYSNEVKEQLLDVSHQTLLQYGAVSELVAKAMADGVRRKLQTDIALATTGIAGPTGGSPEKPIGTVWIACSTNRFTIAKLLHCNGSRESIQIEAVEKTLCFALNLLSSHETTNL